MFLYFFLNETIEVIMITLENEHLCENPLKNVLIHHKLHSSKNMFAPFCILSQCGLFFFHPLFNKNVSIGFRFFGGHNIFLVLC